ncbi:hypothetical protein BBI15_16130 [Planococcus plakortidis]|uniref:Uncharacterized protein n=2 Tax=Planococcus plakortidis TaxID=1038856 RepID=A0A1C7EDX0_9BACL|nr:hypothetical protein BBI15_16130 [Planococcus plakortidis]
MEMEELPMTRTFVILLIVSALLFIGFYFAITLYNRFIGGFASLGELLPAGLIYDVLAAMIRA